MMNHLLNGVIRFSLHQRVVVAVMAVFLLVYGGWQIAELPIDVFPSLDRPRVVVMTEAPGLAPEEVESLITFPLETALNGATGVQAVRTASGIGLSVIYVEFDWGTDIFDDRQIVAERLALAADRMPPGVTPQLAPISSVMGQIMIIGMWSEDGSTSPMKLRTLADWVVRQRVLTIPGVSQVFVMGGDRKQFQVLVDPDELLRYGVTLEEVKTAVAESNANATGGYLDEQGPNELLVRSLGRIQSTGQLEEVVVKIRDGRPVLVRQVARVIEGPQVKRGDSSAYVRKESGRFEGGPAVLLTINKQPGADTRRVSSQIVEALEELKSGLPEDVQLHPEMYQQRAFIDLAVANVTEALRDGGVLVVVILFLFLLNFRTTFITLTAIPLSIVTTGIIFTGFGLSINTMTLGGLTTDFYRRFRPAASDHFCLRLARTLTLLFGLVGTASAVWIASLGSDQIWRESFKIVSLLSGGLGGLFVAGIFTRRATAPGMIVGFLASGVVLYFVSTAGVVHFFLYGGVGMFSCVILGWLASRILPWGATAPAGLTGHSLFR